MHTLADSLNYAARHYSENPALICGNVRLTYGQFIERCKLLGGALCELGLESGDRVAILSANSHQYIETYMTVPSAGFAVVPLNSRHAQAEIAYVLEDSGARVLLTDRDSSDFQSLVEHKFYFSSNTLILLYISINHSHSRLDYNIFVH